MIKVFMMILGVILMSFLMPASGFLETSSTAAKPETSTGQQAASASEENKEADGAAEKKIPGEPAAGDKTGALKKAGAENQKKKEEASGSKPLLDRRWILKMKKEKPIPPAKKAILPWKSEEQKARCEVLSKELRETFKNARYYSIHGDACNTAAHAGLFLKATQQCAQECPAGFLEQKGYTRTIIQNVDKLLELGSRRCLERPSTGAKIKKSPGNQP